MDYNVLNKNQKDRMKAISDPAYVMKWEAQNLWIIFWEHFQKLENIRKTRKWNMK